MYRKCMGDTIPMTIPLYDHYTYKRFEWGHYTYDHTPIRPLHIYRVCMGDTIPLTIALNDPYIYIGYAWRPYTYDPILYDHIHI